MLGYKCHEQLEEHVENLQNIENNERIFNVFQCKQLFGTLKQSLEEIVDSFDRRLLRID